MSYWGAILKNKGILILLILGFWNHAWASEYIFSYRLSVKNGIVSNEKYYFSRAMIHSRDLKYTKNPLRTCEIVHNTKTEKQFLQEYKQDILECFFKWGVKLEDWSKNLNHKNKSTTYLAIPATRIEVLYANEVAVISHLSKEVK